MTEIIVQKTLRGIRLPVKRGLSSLWKHKCMYRWVCTVHIQERWAQVQLNNTTRHLQCPQTQPLEVKVREEEMFSGRRDFFFFRPFYSYIHKGLPCDPPAYWLCTGSQLHTPPTHSNDAAVWTLPESLFKVRWMGNPVEWHLGVHWPTPGVDTFPYIVGLCLHIHTQLPKGYVSIIPHISTHISRPATSVSCQFLVSPMKQP